LLKKSTGKLQFSLCQTSVWFFG